MFEDNIILKGFIFFGLGLSVSATENMQTAVGCTVNPKVIGIQQPRSTKKDGFTTLWLPGIMPGKVAELHLYFGRDYHVVGIGPREV